MNANLFSRKIEMTKTEAKAAGKPNTTEYNTLLELMKNFPGFQIEIVKSAAKKADHFKGLDYDYMENYIKSHQPELLKTFLDVWRQTGACCDPFYQSSSGCGCGSFRQR